MWEFDIDELKWTLLDIKGSCPDPRGGCQLALHGDVLFVFGGHSMVWERGGEADKVFDDVWALDLDSLHVRFLLKTRASCWLGFSLSVVCRMQQLANAKTSISK